MAKTNPELSAGDLDRRLALLSPVYNAEGDEITDYETAGKAWGAINPNFGMEENEAGRVVSKNTLEIRIRPRADIDARWRIADGPHTYEVLAILDVERRGAQQRLLCMEVL